MLVRLDRVINEHKCPIVGSVRLRFSLSMSALCSTDEAKTNSKDLDQMSLVKSSIRPPMFLSIFFEPISTVTILLASQIDNGISKRYRLIQKIVLGSPW